MKEVARLMVLGILRTKPMSGYEIQQVLQVSQTDRWAGILPGSIYHALKKMEKEELVEIDSMEQTGHRTKAIYKITSKGEEEFVNLLKESLSAPSVQLPTQLYTGLSFIASLDKHAVLEALHSQKQIIEKELEQQKQGMRSKKQYIEIDEITSLTFQSIFKQYELQLEFLESLINVYEKK